MLRTVQTLLRQLSSILGVINSFLLMTFSFYLILFPMAMIRRLFVSRKREPKWHTRTPLHPKHFEKQY